MYTLLYNVYNVYIVRALPSSVHLVACMNQENYKFHAKCTTHYVTITYTFNLLLPLLFCHLGSTPPIVLETNYPKSIYY